MTKKLNSKTVYKNPYMEVFEDQVEFEDGKKGIYGYTKRNNFSLVIPYTGSSFIMVRQYRYPVQVMSLEFPAGSHPESPDMDPLELARHEAQEETGYTAKKMERLGALNTAPASFRSTFTVFLATDLQKGAQKLDAEEVGLEVIEVPVREFEQLLLNGKITDSPTVAAYALLKARGF